MKARGLLRFCALAGGVAAVSSFARADAPIDQYGLFNGTNDVIKDNRTGLYWQRYASSTTTDYPGAFGVCATVSLDTWTTGWRVPSYKELMTLVDEAPHTEYENGALVQKAVDPNAFPGTTVNAPYWTSSPFPGNAGEAYTIDFSTGIPHDAGVGNNGYVRCVHD